MVTDQQLGMIEVLIKKIEHALHALGAKGEEFDEQINSIENILPAPLVKQLRAISTVYTKALTKNDYEIQDMLKFQKVASQTIRALLQFAVKKNREARNKKLRTLFLTLFLMGVAIIAGAFLFQ